MKHVENINKVEILNYDYLGVFLSFVCGIHCLAIQVLLVYLPLVGESIENMWVHTVMVVFALLAFHQSVFKDYKHHKSKLTFGLGLAGISLFVISYISELIHHWSHDHVHIAAHGEEKTMAFIAISGAVLLISSHILNIKKCKCPKHESALM